jgi:hypothetical protein
LRDFKDIFKSISFTQIRSNTSGPIGIYSFYLGFEKDFRYSYQTIPGYGNGTYHFTMADIDLSELFSEEESEELLFIQVEDKEVLQSRIFFSIDFPDID